jgi:hypothetical protein
MDLQVLDVTNNRYKLLVYGSSEMTVGAGDPNEGITDIIRAVDSRSFA